ncbi:hypothetical protein NE865_07495 [Phthorimaea operculella]|nr:hypothetical protein NE865_07495 [Phthorimaea operculella]
MPVIDVEEIHTILKGLTRVQNYKKDGKYIENQGADYSLTLQWFKQCRIIDGKVITENLFNASYERLSPNRENLTLAQMVTLFCILSRDTNQEIDAIAVKFEEVKDEVIQEIRDFWREVEDLYRSQKKNNISIDTDSSNDGGITFNF